MTDPPRRPRGRTNLSVQDLGAELLLHDQANDRVHILNETAVQVWHLCDGRHEREAIAEQMVKRFPNVDPEMVRDDTFRVIEDFHQKGLLADEGGTEQ